MTLEFLIVLCWAYFATLALSVLGIDRFLQRRAEKYFERMDANWRNRRLEHRVERIESDLASLHVEFHAEIERLQKASNQS